VNDAWEYRKNLAHVGTHCSHGKWWSEDCSSCVALVNQGGRLLKGRHSKDDE
jgi:hypothetical protein